MPWLCKKMRRPKVAEKKAVDPEMEPDLDAISAELPVVDRPLTREVIVLQKTIELGPKARMPVMWDAYLSNSPVIEPAVAAAPLAQNVDNLPLLNNSQSYGDLKPAALPNPPSVGDAPAPPVALAPAASMAAPVAVAPAPQAVVPVAQPNTMSQANNIASNAHNVSQQSTGNINMGSILAQNPVPAPGQTTMTYNAPAVAANPQPAATSQPSISSLANDSNFAAGFMAATALHSNQIREMLSQAFMAGMPVPTPTPAPAAPVAPVAQGNAFDFLQSAGLVQNNNPLQVNATPQGNHNFPTAAAATHTAEVFQNNNLTPQTPHVVAAPVAAAAPVGNNYTPEHVQQSAPIDQATQQLQQFQAYQSQFQ